MKRNWIQTRYLFALLLISCSIYSVGKASPAERIERLTCEFINNPLDIDIPHPRFSWIMVSTERNQKQVAYELILSDNIGDINQMKSNIWSTGEILSSQNLLIRYNGPLLKSFTRYYWRVRIVNQDKKISSWSEPAWFETSMLNDTDFKAKWISDGSSQPTKDEDFHKDDPMPLFRKSFDVNKKISSARLYITGLGYYEAYLNGQKIGDHKLDPGWTNYKKQVLYSVYDITGQIQNGNNVIGVMVGNGWFNVLPLRMWGQYNLRDVLTSGRPCIKAEVRVTYTNGSIEVIATDKTWQSLPGPIIRNSVYLGEHYDARLEQQGWSTLNKINGLRSVQEINGPSGKLAAQMQPPIIITKVLKPVDITELKNGVFVFDMGQNFAGVARIKVQGPAGTHIVLRYGEDIYKDGNVNIMTSVAGQIKTGQGGPGAPEIAWQEDSYILKGKGLETWSPRFTFHGFRYIEVTGWPGKPSLNDIEGLCLSADVDTAGNFTSSNPMLNKLNEVIKWTFRSNLFSVQSDCPAREKFGYGGDMLCTAEAFIFNFNMANFYGKVMKDFINDQRPLGGFTETAPFVGIDSEGPGDGSGPLGFQLSFPYVLKQLYDFYGDKDVIVDNYDALVREVKFLTDKADNLLYYKGLSDHESLDKKPIGLTESAFFYYHVKLIAGFAEILGKTKDVEIYNSLAGKIKDAINSKFLNSETGQYDNGTQTAQVFALWFDLVPGTHKDKVLKMLLLDIQKNNGHLSTGIFATKMLLDVLRTNNLNETAYEIVNKKDFPGWGYMIENGATTLWETWASSDNIYSKDHPMFGSVSEWFYRSLLGINAGSPGFSKIIIKPQPVSGLTFAKGNYNSVNGYITSDWIIDENRFRLNVVIPANTVGEIWVPAGNDRNIFEGGKSVKQVNDIDFLRKEDGYSVFAVGSGSYSFEVR